MDDSSTSSESDISFDDAEENTFSSGSSDDSVSNNEEEESFHSSMYVDNNDDDDEEDDEIFNNYSARLSKRIHVAYGIVDKFLLDKAKSEHQTVLRNVYVTCQSTNPSPLQLFSIFFNSSTLNKLLKWVLEYSPSGAVINGGDIMAFIRIVLLAQYHGTSVTHLFRPSQQHRYNLGDYISHTKFQIIMAAMNSRVKRGQIDIPPIYRNDEIIDIFDCFGRDCAMIGFCIGSSMVALDDDLWRCRSKLARACSMQQINNPKKGMGIVHHAVVSVTTGIYCGGYVQHQDDTVAHSVDTLYRILCRSKVGHKIDLQGTIFFMDRGYGGIEGQIIQQLLDCGGNIHGTAKRMSSFPFTYGQIPKQNQQLISESGALSVYESSMSMQRNNGENVRLDAIGFRNGLGRVVLMRTTLPQFGRGKMELVPSKKRITTTAATGKHYLIVQFEEEKVVVATETQASPEWFLARRFRITGTSAMVLLQFLANACIEAGRENASPLRDEEAGRLDNASPVRDEEAGRENASPLRDEEAGRLDNASPVCDEVIAEGVWINILHMIGLLQVIRYTEQHRKSLMNLTVVKLRRIINNNAATLTIPKPKKADLVDTIIGNSLPIARDDDNPGDTTPLSVSLLRTWLMSPFRGNYATYVGTQNEINVRRQLPAFILAQTEVNRRPIKILQIVEYGLLLNRRFQEIAFSPDGICVSEEKRHGERTRFLSLLEIKTKVKEELVASEYKIAQDHGVYIEVELSIEAQQNRNDFVDFHQVVPEIEHRAQLLHGMASGNLNSAYYVVANDRTIIRVVHLRFRDGESATFYTHIVIGTMRSQGVDWLKGGNIPDLDNNLYRNKLKYLVDDHTVNQSLQLSRSLDVEYIQQGETIPPLFRLLPESVALWNKCKGPIDNYSRMLKNCKIKVGKLTPIGNMWLHIINTAVYNAFQTFTMLHTSNFLNECSTWDSFTRQRSNFRSNNEATMLCFINKLIDDMEKNIQSAESSFGNNGHNGDDDGKSKRVYNYRDAYFTQQKMISRRRSSIGHTPIKIKAKRCVWCCGSLYIEPLKEHYRMGRKTSFMCQSCKVPLCQVIRKGKLTSCFQEWHTRKKLNNPCANHTLKQNNNKENGSECSDDEIDDDEIDDSQRNAKKARINPLREVTNIK